MLTNQRPTVQIISVILVMQLYPNPLQPVLCDPIYNVFCDGFLIYFLFFIDYKCPLVLCQVARLLIDTVNTVNIQIKEMKYHMQHFAYYVSYPFYILQYSFGKSMQRIFYKFNINIDATEMNFWPRISSDHDGRLLEWSIL